MKVLIAEDDQVSRRLLQATLARSGYDVLVAEDGAEAWEAVQRDSDVRLAVLDWMMPTLDGVEVCRRIRQRANRRYVYVILLTAKGRREDIVAGLEVGADDYVTKPYDPQELRLRVKAGQRILELETALEERVHELQESLTHVRRLQGLLPICMFCKSIRGDQNTWKRIEDYIAEHSEATLTHSLCEECLAKEYPAVAEPMEKP